MTLLLVALVVVVLALLVVLDRQADRAHEDRQAHRLEVTGLLQRIQAPAAAVLQHTVDMAPEREGPMFSNEFAEAERHLEQVFEPVEER